MRGSATSCVIAVSNGVRTYSLVRAPEQADGHALEAIDAAVHHAHVERVLASAMDSITTSPWGTTTRAAARLVAFARTCSTRWRGAPLLDRR